MNTLIANYTGFSGRLNRQPYWIGAIVLALIAAIVSLVLLPVIGLSVMPGMPQLDGTPNAADVGRVLSAAQSRSSWVSLVLFLVFAYPSAAIAIKRRHDRNNNGYDVWIYFALLLVMQVVSALGIGMGTLDVGGTAIPVPGPIVTGLGAIVGIYGIYLLVVLGFLKGTAGPNNYGPDPLQG